MPPTLADSRFHRGVELFNAGRYFDAHEVWEHLWRDCDQSDRRFVHSLIHAAVALYQLGRGNTAAARTQAVRGAAKAGEFPPVYLGVDAARLWEDLTAALRTGGLAVRIHTTPNTGKEDA